MKRKEARNEENEPFHVAVSKMVMELEPNEF